MPDIVRVEVLIQHIRRTNEDDNWYHAVAGDVCLGLIMKRNATSFSTGLLVLRGCPCILWQIASSISLKLENP